MNPGVSSMFVREIVIAAWELLRDGQQPTDEQISAKADEMFARMKRGEL